MLESLKRIGLNPGSGSAINRMNIYNILDELKPQFGCLHHENSSGTTVAVTTTPTKLTVFSDSHHFNGQIVAEHTTDDITIQETNDYKNPLFFEQFGTGITGYGLAVKQSLTIAFSSGGSYVVNIELYVDGVASGIIHRYRTQGSEQQAMEFDRFFVKNDSVLEYYIYSDASSFNITVYQISVDVEKMPLAVDSVVTDFEEI